MPWSDSGHNGSRSRVRVLPEYREASIDSYYSGSQSSRSPSMSPPAKMAAIQPVDKLPAWAAELDLHDSHSENELPVRAASPYLTRGSITGNRQPSAVPRLSLSMATAHKAAASNEKTPSLSAINLKGGGGEGGHSPSMPNIFSSDSVRNGGDGQAGVIRKTTPPYSPPGKSQYRSLPSSSRGSSAATPMQVSAGTPA
eukprot:CAMPEP_0173120384 /NCGR_PEP_ID=MMETSP1102-20130122/52492_1 /TAXON_ID=49646 /ORGANISM="Geminigera sp., Strain Caron Lab Isolate" /LENGTH=197 /DNA_ID=CAMNT_0014026457 /DNA_START=68 /DNA_END=657 /DNA_ORIENTATION=+